MNKKTVLLLIIFLLCSVFISSNPLESSFSNPVWIEFSIGIAYDIQDREMDIDLTHLEMNVYFKNYSGFGLGITTRDIWGFYVSGLHLFEIPGVDFLLIPVKLKAGYYSAYGDQFMGFALSTGAKGIIKIPAKDDLQNYFITDLLGSVNYYTVARSNNSPINFYAEIYPGFIMEVSDE